MAESALARRFPWHLMLALGAVAMLLFLTGLTRDPYPYFDETHYVPAARTLLALDGPANVEHPLLGKELIAIGIMLFGDNAFGWRFFASVSGAVALMSFFAIGWQVLGRTRPALVAALLALFNFTLFVQARIAMIDGPMAALVLAAIAVTLAAARARRGVRAWALLAGVLFGLGTAAKWAGVPYLALAGLALLVARFRDGGWRSVAAVLLLGAASAITYFLTFLPAFFYRNEPMTLAGLLPFQQRMYALQTQPLAAHTYQSTWWSWPLDLRPIWYLYEPVDGIQRGVLMVGNPAVMWGGLAALALCLGLGLWRRQGALLAPVALWAGAYLPWVVIPKKIGFFYYYYLPSIFICLAIAAAADALDPQGRRRLGWWAVAVAGGLFLWFYPIIAATPLEGPRAFERWMWLPGWP